MPLWGEADLLFGIFWKFYLFFSGGFFFQFFRLHVWRVPYEACIPLKYGDPIHKLNQQIRRLIPGVKFGVKFLAVDWPQPNLRKRWHKALVKL